MLRDATRKPSLRASLRLEHESFAPLRKLRALGQEGMWWQEKCALQSISGSLGEHKFVIVDDFLSCDNINALAETARQLYREGHMKRGSEEQRGWHEEFWGGGHEHVLDKVETHRWNLQGDHRIWIAD